MVPPLTLPDNEIIHRLNDMPVGTLYCLSSRDVFARGSDYHAKGRVLFMEWDKKGALLVFIKGSRLKPYIVSIATDGRGLRYHCGCPVWSDLNNCKHAV